MLVPPVAADGPARTTVTQDIMIIHVDEIGNPFSVRPSAFSSLAHRSGLVNVMYNHNFTVSS